MVSDIHLTAYRHAFWGGRDATEEVVFLAEDLTGASLAWSFADEPGGEVLFTLENADAGAQGISTSYESDYLHPVRGVPVGASILVPQIDSQTLQQLPSPVPAHADICLTHTLYVTRSGGTKQATLTGKFRVRQGAPN